MTTPIEGLKVGEAPAQPPQTENLFTLDQINPWEERTEVLLYGRPGTGKTVTASSFPGPFRWIDADRGTKSLVWAQKAGICHTAANEIVIFRVDEPEGGYVDKPEAFDLMTDMIDFWFSPAEVDKWLTLVIDSFTTINEWVLNKGLSLNYHTKMPDSKKVLSSSHKVNLEVMARIVTGQQDYKSAQAFCTVFLDKIRGKCARYNKNLVVIAHEWTDTNEDGNVIAYKPLLIGQLRERFGKDFDDIWYTEMYSKAGGVEVKVRVHGGPKHVAKTRWGAILSTEEPADYRLIVGKVKAFYTKS